MYSIVFTTKNSNNASYQGQNYQLHFSAKNSRLVEVYFAKVLDLKVCLETGDRKITISKAKS